MFPIILSNHIVKGFYIVRVIELAVGQVFGLHQVASSWWPLPYADFGTHFCLHTDRTLLRV